MNVSIRLSGFLLLGMLGCFVASGQSQAPQIYTRDTCTKVRDGKGAEYAAFLRDVSVKLAKVRMEAQGSKMIGYTIAQAVAPVGRSARCDYHLVSVYNGFPPEGGGPDQTSAEMQKAGIAMSREAMVAKRNDLSFLVSTDVWVGVGSAGMPVKGGIARVNYDKVQPGKMREYITGLREGWLPLAEAAAKELKTGWRASALVMPGGESLPYNANTVDFFPNWEAFGKGIPTRDLWNKVHPNRDMTAHFDAQTAIRQRPRVDTYQIVELLTK